MNVLKINRTIILKFFGFLILFHSTVFANSTVSISQSTVNSIHVKTTQHNNLSESKEMTSISLNSFGDSGMILMVILSSLLGAFFVRDEFDSFA